MGGFSRKRFWIGGALVIVLALATGAVFVASTWGEVNRVLIERPAPGSVEAAAAPEDEEAPNQPPGFELIVPPSGDGVDVFLVVGSDSRESLADTQGFGEFEGKRADVVMVLIRPRSGKTAAVLSLPRDLLVQDICSAGEHRLNEALEGCSDLNGPTAVIVTVESLIGIGIDHFVMVDLGGFQEAVDAVGGYEICLERRVRDIKANLELPAGCTQATGGQTLAWLRSRTTQELTDNGWRTVPGVNDLMRNERQRDFLISMIGRLSDFSSPQDVAGVARSVAPYVTVDSGLTLVDAIGLAWTMRGLGDGSIRVLEVPVVDAVTEHGAEVLVSTVDIGDLVDSYLSPEVAGKPALSQIG